MPHGGKAMMFRIFYQVGLAGIGGRYYEDVEAISPKKAMKQIMDAHNHVNIVSVFDADGNILYKGKKL